MPSHPSFRRCAASVLALALALTLSPALLAAEGFDDRTRPDLVVVPDVRGQTLNGAAAQVAVAGLVPRHAAYAPGNLDTSPVRRQWPNAGQRVPQGTVVALELATAPAAVAASEPAVLAAPAQLARASVKASFEVAPVKRQRWDAAAWWLAGVVCVAMLALAWRHDPRPYVALRSELAAYDVLVASPPLSAPSRAEVPEPRWSGVRGTSLRGAPAYAVVASGAIAGPVTEA